MIFEWDSTKARANALKHGVRFREASSVFRDSLATTFPDPSHSRHEERFVTVGISTAGRILVVAHTDRAHATRLISARPATPRERRFYEENQ
ncbi:MAG: BrnT family toxin [Vicinamibacteria bacterium]